MAEYWEVQGSIPGLGKTLAPKLALISLLIILISVRDIFRLINYEKIIKNLK